MNNILFYIYNRMGHGEKSIALALGGTILLFIFVMIILAADISNPEPTGLKLISIQLEEIKVLLQTLIEQKP